MISCPSMLVIGAAHRNAGKTEFACEVIRRQAPVHRVVGVKITCLEEHEDPCLPSGEGCGACRGASVATPYCLSEELRPDRGKDTSRLLRAGAAQVLWLRVLPQHLAAGVAALLARIPSGAPVVCESNSVRLVLVPGLFLVMRRADDPAMKPSCAAVVRHADRIVVFHGDGWDLAPDRLAVVGDRWQLQPDDGPGESPLGGGALI
jgi:hypothetical protein